MPNSKLKTGCGSLEQIPGSESVMFCLLAPGHEGEHQFPPMPAPLFPISPRVMTTEELVAAREFVATAAKYSPPERSLSMRHLCILLANAEATR